MLKVKLNENLFHGFRNYYKGEIVNIEDENTLPKCSYKIIEIYKNKTTDDKIFLKKYKKDKK